MLSAVIKSPYAPFSRRDAIVVLGCPPGPALDERAHTAAALFAAGGAPRVIATGYRGEAEAVAGIVPFAELEPHATSTAENAAFVAAMLPAGASVWLVTHRFHARRAVYLFGRAGLHAAAWPASDRHRASWYAREAAAWLRAIAGRSRAPLRPRRSS